MIEISSIFLAIIFLAINHLAFDIFFSENKDLSSFGFWSTNDEELQSFLQSLVPGNLISCVKCDLIPEKKFRSK